MTAPAWSGAPTPVFRTKLLAAPDLVFGMVHLLGMEYRPALADLPDQRLWRIDRDADYGPLNTAARGRVDRERIRRHWPDVLRVTASIYTGQVRAYDVTRVLQRDGNPTPLGEAIASYGRIFKSLHILACVDDEPYRRDIKAIRNLHEERHSLAARIFHGKKGELYQRYRAGMEDQLSALGLVVNCVVLWNTVYINAALEQLRGGGHSVRDEDVARLSPFVRPATSTSTATTRSRCPSSPAGSENSATPTTPITTSKTELEPRSQPSAARHRRPGVPTESPRRRVPLSRAYARAGPSTAAPRPRQKQAAVSRDACLHADAGVAVAATVVRCPDRRSRRSVRDEGWRAGRPLCGAPAPSGWLGRMRSR
jgi:hypothetical protein